MKHMKNWIFALLFTALAGGSALALVPQPAAAVSNVAECSRGFLTFPTWFRDLVKVDNGECVIMSPDEVGGISNFIWRIVLNIIEIGLLLVGYIAVAFILYGGFHFLTSAGDPQKAVEARKSILNAVIGLVVSIASVAIINLVMGIL